MLAKEFHGLAWYAVKLAASGGFALSYTIPHVMEGKHTRIPFESPEVQKTIRDIGKTTMFSSHEVERLFRMAMMNNRKP